MPQTTDSCRPRELVRVKISEYFVEEFRRKFARWIELHVALCLAMTMFPVTLGGPNLSGWSREP